MIPLKPSSILHSPDSMAVLARRLFAGNALYMTIVEALAIREVGLDDHWRSLSQLYKRAVASQSCFTPIAGITRIIHGIYKCCQCTTLTESGKQSEFNADKNSGIT